MAKTLTVTCDVCGTIKKEANHWFMARYSHGVFECLFWNDDTLEMIGDATLRHICSESCLHKVLSQIMQYASDTQAPMD